MLLFLGENNLPTYLAVSTDVGSDNKIIGINLVGKIVFLSDTQEWKYTAPDFTLKDYIVQGGGSGVTKFIQLTDVPNSYTGAANKPVKVNVTETGLEFGAINDDELVMQDIITNNVDSSNHGFAPKSPADATTFLNGDVTPTYANVKDSDLATTDIITNNVSSTKHGFTPKSPADATQFLNGASTPAYTNVKDSDLSTSNITTNNVSISKHGFTPILPNDATLFLNGVGDYTVPAGVGITMNQADPLEILHRITGSNPDDDEFDDGNMSSYTRLTTASFGSVTWQEERHVQSVAFSGMEANKGSYTLKAGTLADNEYFECAFNYLNDAGAGEGAGLIITDGTSPTSHGYGFWGYWPVVKTISGTLNSMNTVVTGGQALPVFGGASWFKHRLYRINSTTFGASISFDGKLWTDYGLTTVNPAFTPTHFGLWVSNWGSANALIAFHYIRHKTIGVD